MNRNNVGLLGMAIAATIVTGLAAPAKAAIFTWASNPSTSYVPYFMTVGNKITIGATAQSVTALGVQDPFGQFNGATSVQVGIWDASGSPVISTIVTQANSTLGADLYYYTTVAPTTLSAGADYFIGALVGVANTPAFNDYGNGTGYTPSAAYTIDFAAANGFDTNTFSAPTGNSGGAAGRWAPANALTSDVSTTPEPASLGLLGLGALGLLARRPARKLATA